MKKIVLAVCILCMAFLTALPAFAAEEALPLTLSAYEKELTDGNEKRKVAVRESITVSCETPIDSLYLIFYDQTTELLLRSGDQERTLTASYLRQYISISDLFGGARNEIVLSLKEPVSLTELYGFSGALPSWVQVWQEPCQEADLCLMTTHADDEQLFFAGVLPTYAGERELEVQVIYFTDHINEPLRRHELLRGLWTVGVEHYPVIGPFPDLYSKSGEVAEGQLKSKGFSHEDIVGFQVEMLRRFKPLVVVGHDLLGEYGHGQHIVNSATLQEAVLAAGNGENFADSAEQYGVWDVPKTYLHLWQENQIQMNWDVPLEHFGGKTAFQVTQEGFLCHDSQQYTWFRRWLNGNNGEITRADQIDTHSPCAYGLFRSLVGEDVEKNDFFENQLSYAQIRQKEEEERLRREEEERLRIEEEKRKEEERKKAEAEEKARLEAQRKKAEEQETQKLFFAVAAGGGSVILLGIAAVVIARRRRPVRRIKRRNVDQNDDSSGIIM
ncbi:MAG: PIG-L family deacetylase [Clostridia bacterium]|nr:PIG-L family deacetylase [Clostridia bacterium]